MARHNEIDDAVTLIVRLSHESAFHSVAKGRHGEIDVENPTQENI